MTVRSLARALCRLDGIDPDRMCSGSPAWEINADEAARAIQALALISVQPDLFGAA